MSLGRKTLVLFLVLGFAMGIGSYLALRVAVLPAFSDFERKSVEEALARVAGAMEAELDGLRIMNIEYSSWTDTYKFAQGVYPEYVDENLDPSYWHSVDINMMLLFDSDGNPLPGSLGFTADDTNADITPDLLKMLPPDNPLVRHDSTSSSMSGLLNTKFGIMDVASFPILRSSGEGPVAGSLVIGSFITDARQTALGDRATADIAIHALGQSNLPTQVVAALGDRDDLDASPMVATYADFAHGVSVVNDIYGKPAAVLEVRLPRTISAIGESTIRTAMLFLAVASIGFLLAALFFTQRLIVAPVGDLSRKILKIRRTGKLEMDVGNPRADEVGMLASQFAELTAGLAKAGKELENARDEALSMSKAKSEFLARMSHEIRTPMNGVLGMTELLQNTTLDEKQQRFARTIYSSAESLLHIINDILDISKVESGKLELDVAPFNLRHVAEECLDLLADNAHSKGLELIGKIPPDCHTHVEGDALRLRQILINLLSNAVKFTEQGEIIVRVEELEHDADTINYRFEVEDTGVGIDGKNLEKVFEPFTQEDGSTTRRYGGTGLGLSICRQLLELMNGEIGVESRPGRGTSFWFTVPLLRDKASPQDMQLELLDGNRVLVVDDNAVNRSVLQHQLEDWRMHVETAESGAEALGILASAAGKDAPFDIALLDMNMPNMDGLELAAAIRDIATIEDPPLIMLSSISSGDAGEDREKSHVDAWLTKPVRQARLYDVLVSHLSRAGAARSQVDDQVESLSANNDNASRNLKVLLAEDNEVNQLVAVGMLNELGHTTTVVVNGHEAVAARKSQDFDIVLMDCQMPAMDGFEATSEIRRWETEQGQAPITVVAVTANALSGDRERCLAAGMDDYLSKPFSLQKLGAALAANTISVPADSKRHVLIVEDNVINQQVAHAMLQEFGYTAEVVSDGRQALRAMETAEFDLVLMDCHMPVLNGYDATREIRSREEASEEGRRVPIVAVTADLMESNRERCLSCGMDDYMTKPFTEQQLRLVIARWLGVTDDEDAATVAVDSDGFSELTATTSLASIDRAALEEIYQFDKTEGKSMVREIVMSYCAASTKLILQLRAAVAEGDAEQVELLAHSLKGSSGQIGAVLLAALCEQILTSVRDNALDDAPSLCERAAVEHSAVIIALDKEMQRIAA